MTEYIVFYICVVCGHEWEMIQNHKETEICPKCGEKGIPAKEFSEFKTPLEQQLWDFGEWQK